MRRSAGPGLVLLLGLVPFLLVAALIVGLLFMSAVGGALNPTPTTTTVQTRVAR